MSHLHLISKAENPDRKADVVFVHGVGGDAFETWRHGRDSSSSWPHWLAEDFPDVGVWSFGYAASPTEWAQRLGFLDSKRRDAGHAMSVLARSRNALKYFVEKDLGKKPLFFIGHSLGGTVIKQVLRGSADACLSDDVAELSLGVLFGQTRAVLFLATPHSGIELASLAVHFKDVVAPTKPILDIQAGNEHLLDLRNWYRNAASGIETQSFSEEKGLKGVLAIVPPESADPGTRGSPFPMDEDHSSIAKPQSREALVYLSAKKMLLRVLSTRLSVVPAPTVNVGSWSTQPPPIEIHIDGTSLTQPDRLRIPHQLPPAAHEFFGRKTQRDQLVARLLARKNTAVVGPAGLGKTALAAIALQSAVGDTPDSLANSPFPDGVVYLDLYAHHGLADPAWNGLANSLAGTGFKQEAPPAERATEACRSRLILVIIEGGEEADGYDGRSRLTDIKAVIAPENRVLLLTRDSSQTIAIDTIRLEEALEPDDAQALLNELAPRIDDVTRESLLTLLMGHPLALTWAGHLLARGDEDPSRLVAEWRTEELPRLSDPLRAERTLKWLYDRSVRGLGDVPKTLLASAGILAHAPFPLNAVVAALDVNSAESERVARNGLRALVQRGLLRRAEAPDHWAFTHVLGYRFARQGSRSNSVLRQRLGAWHRHEIEAVFDDSVTAGTVQAAELLGHVSALLRTDNKQGLWSLSEYLLHDAQDHLFDLGFLGLARASLSAVEGWFDRLSPDVLADDIWLRERSALSNRQGDVLRTQGDLAGALAAYRDGMAVNKRLAGAAPSNATWQRNLSVSQDQIGDVMLERGDLAGALAAYRDGMAVRTRQAEVDPSNAIWQRDLSVSQNRIGDVLLEQGDLAGALAAYRDGMAVRTRLAEADPSNATWQRDLSVSQDRIGDVLRAQGDLAGALAAYRDGMAVSKRLAEADPSNATWQRDLSVSQDRIGDVLRAQGDLTGGLAAYRDGMAVRTRLAEADPSNATWQRDLSYSLTTIAAALETQGRRQEALAHAEQSLSIDERLAALDPSNAMWQRDVSVSRAMVTRMRG